MDIGLYRGGPCTLEALGKSDSPMILQTKYSSKLLKVEEEPLLHYFSIVVLATIRYTTWCKWDQDLKRPVECPITFPEFCGFTAILCNQIKYSNCGLLFLAVCLSMSNKHFGARLGDQSDPDPDPNPDPDPDSDPDPNPDPSRLQLFVIINWR
ncbi:hypothetical protein NQ317_019827 [Molorchus minor]|uniref:Uncharacterized protein n=1 Tax=Molorchus minor TaxID=1323400 RepID=A0ABQ9J385_9CUCU|nr:hypothetical protein NQ317_019827 [Molorchus minor]